MAEEWRDVALTATSCLLVAGTSEDALEFLDAATTKLAARAEVLRRHAMGRMFKAAEICLADPDQDGVSGTTLLGDARDEIAEISDSHAAAGRLVEHFQGYLREQGQGDDALAQRWESFRTDALGHADQALRSLRSALSFAEAADDVFAVAQGLPYASWLCEKWSSAAEALARDASQQVATAQTQVQEMQHAVVVQFFDLQRTLKKVDEQQWMALARTVPGTLLLVGSSSGLMTHFDSLALALHGLPGAGERPGLTDIVPSDSNQRTSSILASIDLLDAAHLEATRLTVLHAEAKHIFARCAPHIGVHGSKLLAWERHHADTCSAAHDILFRVNSLGSLLLALYSVADWASAGRRQAAAEQLLGRAVEDLGHARAALERMGRFVVAETNHVETVLNA